jgi:hypothetical protein
VSPAETATLALGWLLPAFAITAVVEVVAAGLLGFRAPRELAVVALANLATNPAVNLLTAGAMVLMHTRTLRHPGVMAVLAALEVLAVIAEWRIYHYALPLRRTRAFAISVIVNAASLIVGLLAFGTGSPGV